MFFFRPKLLSILNVIFVALIISIAVVGFAAWMLDSLNIHIVILGIISIAFIASWFWYLSNLKSSGVLQSMYDVHNSINSWTPDKQKKENDANSTSSEEKPKNNKKDEKTKERSSSVPLNDKKEKNRSQEVKKRQKNQNK